MCAVGFQSPARVVPASRISTTLRYPCVFLPLTVFLVSDPVFRHQPLLIHTVANSVLVNHLESALTKPCATVSKYGASNPVESALTKSALASSLDSALTKNMGGEGGIALNFRLATVNYCILGPQTDL